MPARTDETAEEVGVFTGETTTQSLLCKHHRWLLGEQTNYSPVSLYLINVHNQLIKQSCSE